MPIRRTNWSVLCVCVCVETLGVLLSTKTHCVDKLQITIRLHTLRLQQEVCLVTIEI
jgi:hypothetical protein